MSLRNLKVFQYPMVQYIPLAMTTILQGQMPKSGNEIKKTMLLVGKTIKEWSKTLNRDYGLELPEISFEGQQLPLLVLQAEVDEANYRGYNVILTGKAKQDHYVLYSLSKQYFYKPKLFFELYDTRSGRLLANFSTFFGSNQGLKI